MFLKYFIWFVVCVTYNVKAADDNHGFRYYNEEACLSSGGICIPSNECGEEQLSKITGLCPKQQNLGVECCYGLSKLATGCHDQGGECFPAAYRCATLTKASDCPSGERCCILI